MALLSPRFSRDSRLQKASENNPPMKQGERGESVATVQRALIDLGFDMPITTSHGRRLPDGIFGSETAKAVREFQRVNGLEVDAIVGRQTLAKLEDLTTALIAAEKARLAATGTLPSSLSWSHHKTLR